MKELASARAQVKETLERLGFEPWIFEDDAGARPHPIEETYLEEVAAADLYVGIFWKKYGERTIQEFKYARNLGKPCFIYDKHSELDGRAPRLQDFLDEISIVETGLTLGRFIIDEELDQILSRDLSHWKTEMVRAGVTARREAPRRIETHLTDVFICHVLADKCTVASPLHEHLNKVGITCSFDRGEILWGHSVPDRINEGLGLARFFIIVVISAALLRGTLDARTLNAALESKRLLPLVVESAELLQLARERRFRIGSHFSRWAGNATEIETELRARIDQEKRQDQAGSPTVPRASTGPAPL